MPEREDDRLLRRARASAHGAVVLDADAPRRSPSSADHGARPRARSSDPSLARAPRAQRVSGRRAAVGERGDHVAPRAPPRRAVAERRPNAREVLDHRHVARGCRGSSSGSSASATRARLEVRPARTPARPRARRRRSRVRCSGSSPAACATAYVSAAGAIRDDERTAGDRRLERRRAALAERGVGRAQHRERRRPHHAGMDSARGSIVTCGAALTTTWSRGSRRCSSRAVATNASRWRCDLLRAAARKEREHAVVGAEAERCAAPSRDRAARRARSSSGCPTNVASMPCARSSGSSNGRIDRRLRDRLARARASRSAPHAHTCGVM